MKIGILVVNFLGSVCKNNAKKTFANWLCTCTSLQIITIVARRTKDYSLSTFTVSNFFQDTLI